MALKYVWNEEKTRSVKVSQIKEFYIFQHYTGLCEVKGLITNSDNVTITSGLTKEEARKFIDKLLDEIG